MMSVGGGKITVSRFDGSGVRVDVYRSLEHMLSELLMNSGDELPCLVRDKLLPEAIKAWDANKYAEEHPSCNRHDDCKAAEVELLAKNPGKKISPSFHCRDEDCEDCFGQ